MSSRKIDFSAIITSLLVLLSMQFAAPNCASAGGYVPSGHHKNPTPAPPQPSSVNVRDYGATGNGTTDDTAAINNASMAATSAQKAVFFPPGTYLHNGVLTFNSVAVIGSGGSSLLLAGNNLTSAVILTGVNCSIQNLVISTQGLTGGTSLSQPETATILIQTASSFTVASDTIVQGVGRYGVLILQSTVGVVQSVAFDGTGSTGDTGIWMDSSQNVSVIGNLFQFESVGVRVTSNNTLSQFIAIQSNTIGNVTYPTANVGVRMTEVNLLSISNNVIQMANASPSVNSNAAIIVERESSSFNVFQNQTYGGYYGIDVASPALGSNSVTQNTLRNCGAYALFLTVDGSVPSSVQLISNAFGECGIANNAPTSSVIFVSGSVSNLANVLVQNNFYEGHSNFLSFYVYGPKLTAANISANGQSQTTLPGNPNN